MGLEAKQSDFYDLQDMDFLELRRFMELSHLEVIKRTLNKKDSKFSGSATIRVRFDAKSPLHLEDIRSLIQKRLTDDLSALNSNFGFGGNISVTEATAQVIHLEKVKELGHKTKTI